MQLKAGSIVALALVLLQSLALRHVLVQLKPYKIMSVPSAGTYALLANVAAVASLVLTVGLTIWFRHRSTWLLPVALSISCSLLFFGLVGLTLLSDTSKEW